MGERKPRFSQRLRKILKAIASSAIELTKGVFIRVSAGFSASVYLLLFLLSIAVPPVVAKISAPAVETLQVESVQQSEVTIQQLASIDEKLEFRVQNQPDAFNLGEEAKQLYQLGQFQEAAGRWQQAAAAFDARGDKLNQARALSNLSLTYQQIGDWERAINAIAESLNLLKIERNTSEQLQVLAQTLNFQGKLQFAVGQTESALESWERAAEIYDRIGDRAGITQMQIDRALAQQKLGLYPRACKTLLQALSLNISDCQQLRQFTPNELTQKLQTLQPPDLLEVLALQSLGDVLRVVGQPVQSEIVLQESLKFAKQLQARENIAAANLSLGNTARVRGKIDDALKYYKQADSEFSTLPIQIQSRLNQLSLIVDERRWSEVQNLLSAIQLNLDNLRPSRTAVDARINLSQSLMCLRVELSDRQPNVSSPILQECLSEEETKSTQTNTLDLDAVPSWEAIINILTTALNQAEILEDARSQANALGYLGGVYQQQGELLTAQNFTERALQIASSVKIPDISYRWQWQLGRLREIQGDEKGAIAAYTAAFQTLQSLRGDLVAINPDVQFTFRDSVEPVYREYVDLLLRPENPAQANLKQARQAIESLQLAELNDFFREACLEAKPEQIDRVVDEAKTRSAVLYGILLKDRIETILKLPGQEELQRYRTAISRVEVESVLTELIDRLNDRTRLPVEVQEVSEPVYDWLIRPAEANLAQNQVKTLVFVLDGLLRNVPMSVLYDREKYLVEKYAVALTPGLQLLAPRPLIEIRLNALTAGLSEERTVEQANLQFAPLPNVPLELAQIQSILPTSELLLNQEFITPEIKEQLIEANYTVVHMATHGQFSSNIEETFILTWDAILNVNELNNLLQLNRPNPSIPIELLVLSACETASGDNRATLGLAGVAVRAGARSTLATLWSVNDESTAELMQQFYRELVTIEETENITKAEALQKAQIGILYNQNQDKKWERPYYWAPFVLVGNWL